MRDVATKWRAEIRLPAVPLVSNETAAVAATSLTDHAGAGR
jgi:hypothetical protein